MALTDFELADALTLADGRAVELETVGDHTLAPLIWVEGGPGFWAHMARPDVELVSDLFCCHLVNAPGCGRTSPPPDLEGYTLAAIIEFWEGVRRALGLDRVAVMGHSWGGLVAAAWAAAHPESVDRLVVIDGYPGGAAVDPGARSRESERALARHEGTDYIEAARVALAEEFVFSSDEESYLRNFEPAWPLYFADPASSLAAPHITRLVREVRLNVPMYNAWFDGPDGFDADLNILPSLQSVACPTLVIAGEHDFVCGPTLNRPMADAIAGARYVEVADAGHVPQYEQPAVFRAALGEWLAQSNRS